MNEFNQIIGYEHIKKQLLNWCDIIKNPLKYRRLNVTPPKGIVFLGFPGVGKTLMAESLIKAVGFKSYLVRRNKNKDDFIPYLEKTFSEAQKNAPSIILLDDLDKFSEYYSEGETTVEFSTVQALIDNVREKEVYVIATAEGSAYLPESLIRKGRFDMQIYVDTPKLKEAEEIIAYYLSDKQYVKGIDIHELAKLLSGYSCAKLKALINQAGIYAGFDNKDVISFPYLLKAAREIIHPLNGTTNEDVKNLKFLAYHEAGHIVMSEILEPTSVVMASVLDEETGDVNAFTDVFRPEEVMKSFSGLEHELLSLLAGREATNIIFKKPDVGCATDYCMARDILLNWVTSCGMEGFDKLNIHYGGEEKSMFLKKRQEKACVKLLDKYATKCHKLLLKNIEFLKEVGKTLLKKKTIYQSDIVKIKETLNNHR